MTEHTTFGAYRQVMSRSPRSVLAVSEKPERAALVDGVLADVSEFDVVVVESIAHGYSRIKALMPDLIVIFVDIDDVAACPLLSMLKLDRELSRIPVVTCATRYGNSEFEEIMAELIAESSYEGCAMQLN